MKTVQDLVNRLNEFNNPTGFSISRCLDITFLKASKCRVVTFQDFIYRIENKFIDLKPHEQKVIIEFLANSNPEDWFAEKKYNIIIGQDNCSPHYSAYRKMGKGEYIVRSTADEDELKSFEYLQFTESEIEQLKLTLPTNMAKIVDLGKVEVKNENH